MKIEQLILTNPDMTVDRENDLSFVIKIQLGFIRSRWSIINNKVSDYEPPSYKDAFYFKVVYE